MDQMNGCAQWHHCASSLRVFVTVVAVMLAIATSRAAELAYPLNVLEDKSDFAFYLNEEVLVSGRVEWRKDGSLTSDYTMTMAGQTAPTHMDIAVDENGIWTRIDMQTPRGPIEIVREGEVIRITSDGDVKTANLRPGTLLFENFTPTLMSQAVIAYDQEAGGKQTFPLFIIPAVVMDASLERLETVERNVMGAWHTFTLYRYGLPGVDVTIWVDEQNRVCFGDVPAQHGAYIRAGYEALRIKEEVDSLISRAQYEVIVERDVGVAMRDGLDLATDIYRPDADRRFPVILVRTPYKKELNELQAMYFARRGYAYAVQDCRGRFSSPGEWEPFFNEPHDGYDTIEWLAIRSWSDGKVGMIGGSYLGWVQWWAAREHPPHLVTIIPNVAPPDPYFNIPYEYGAFFLWGAIWWAEILEKEATADISGKALGDIMDKKYAKLLRHLPVIELDEIVLGEKNRYWREWIRHPDNDDYWARASFLDDLEDVDIPVYHQSGWFDGDGIGSKLNYAAMARHGHGHQKLVLGPWGHTTTATRRGPRNTEFGHNAIVDLDRSYLRWLDRWLKGVENGIDGEPLVSLFVMGSNQWLTGDRYPLPETRFTPFYLASKGNANTSAGDGRLLASPPGDGTTAFDTYSYDPGDPTPDPYFFFSPEDLDDEEETEEEVSVEERRRKRLAYHARVDAERDDILVYETPPLEESLTVAGPISAVLYASSSAKDTDWFMRLTSVDGEEDIFPLVHGVIRARYRDSFAKPKKLKKNEIYEYHIDMWQTGITVAKGSRLRVEVCSARFPTFSRNLNTGGHNETETKYVTAVQKIYHDRDHPSHILLPVIEAPDFKTSFK
ncbi:MAG: CocE/NonD family hydrolase [Candidatus Krumholzibacteria bacterium]|nr:CocE/NonD family hydrolase [Candidatus Krumholzibacteria bacterium]